MTNIFSVGGDSGAWVIDNASGRVCAHVLAWSARNNTAYIAPMEILLNDMTHILRANVTLPGSERGDSTVVPTEAPKASALNHIVDQSQDRPSLGASASQFQQQSLSQRPLPSESSTHCFLNHHDSDVNSNRPHTSNKPYPNPYPTPSPSPPMATSPPCNPLIDNIVLQQSPDMDVLRQINTNSAAVPSRAETLGRRSPPGGKGRGRGRGRGLEVDGMRAGGGVETRG